MRSRAGFGVTGRALDIQVSELSEFEPQERSELVSRVVNVLLAVVILICVSPVMLLTGYARAPIEPHVVVAMVALGVLGSGVAYMLNFRVIERSDATTASTVTYVITLVAVVSGAVVHGEPLGPLQLLAMMCCAASLVLALYRPATTGR